MFRTHLRLSGLALVGAGLLLSASPARATYPIPVKFDTKFQFSAALKVGPHAFAPRAPWYTYFPVDPNLTNPRPQTTAFPPWPTQPAVPFAPIPSPPAPPAPAPADRVTQYAPTWGWPPAAYGYGYGVPIQPVTYSAPQAPSYWYGQ